MNKKGQGKKKGGMIFLLLIIIGLLVWGYIVGKQTSDLSTCNIHFWIFCWKWNTGAISQAGGAVNKLVNGTTIP